MLKETLLVVYTSKNMINWTCMIFSNQFYNPNIQIIKFKKDLRLLCNYYFDCFCYPGSTVTMWVENTHFWSASMVVGFVVDINISLADSLSAKLTLKVTFIFDTLTEYL